MNLPEWFHKKRRNSIELLPTDGPGKVELGSSKVGGRPHLPKEFEWYRYEGTNYDGVTAGRPLSFLAQINLAEIADLDIDGVLPSRGMLQKIEAVRGYFTMKAGRPVSLRRNLREI